MGTTSERQTNPERATVDVWPTAGQILGLGRNATYKAVNNGQIPVVRIGRRLLVPRAALDRLLAGGPAA